MNSEEFYKAINGDYLNTLNRLGNEQIVSHFIKEFKNDQTFNNLRTSYENHNIENAFLAVHTLKGICANLGFTELEKKASTLTEILRKRTFENFVHGIFLILGLVTVACVLLISIYLIVSGIPAIRQIGLINFLFGKKWEPTAATPAFGILPFILTSIYGTAGAIILGVPIGFHDRRVSGENGPGKAESRRLLGSQPAGGHSLGGVRPCGYVGACSGHSQCVQPCRRFRPLGRNNRTCDYDSALNHKSVHDCS